MSDDFDEIPAPAAKDKQLTGVWILGQLIVRAIVVASDSCLFECSVHPFDLTIGPGMIWFGQSMIDVGERTAVFESMLPNAFSCVD